MSNGRQECLPHLPGAGLLPAIGEERAMAIVRVEHEAEVRRTFRVEQVAGMLDVELPNSEPTRDAGAPVRNAELQPGAARIGHRLVAEVPGVEEAWTIGAIVGPSGSGKTTLARAAFGAAVYEPREWPRDRAVVDVLGDGMSGREGEGESGSDGTRSVPTTIKEIARVLTAVGLGSVPTWLKPYHVLSTGERFRADLARAVLRVQGSGFRVQERARSQEPRRVLVVDEFTGSLDRTVAKTTSAALARMVRQESGGGGGPGSKVQSPRSRDAGLRFVAVTCHTDILPWLAPDWVVELASDGQSKLVRGNWPPIELGLEIRRVPQAMWKRFARHHYLAGGLAASATCYGAFAAEEWERGRVGEGENGILAGFCAVVAALGWKKTKRITRLVTLPEFQGLGIASRLLADVARREAARGNRVTITASHPAIVQHCWRSPEWKFVGVKKTGSTRQRYSGREIRSSVGRAVASFEFVRELAAQRGGASG